MEKQTILLVEDEAEIREGIRILLSGENYSILEAPDGPTALSMMNDQIDLVILDVIMPGMSGLRVCEEIRKTSTIPILFLTAKAQESDKLIGLTAGGDDYLGQALLLCGAQRPGQSPSAQVLRLSGQGPARHHLRQRHPQLLRRHPGFGPQPGLGGRGGKGSDRN